MPVEVPAAGDDDFADFETPSTTSTLTSILTSLSPSTGAATTGSPASATSPTSDPYYWPSSSPWYAIWQRHSAREFVVEFWVIIIIGAILAAHFLGLRKNRSLARKWVREHYPILEQEFAMVGADYAGKSNTLETEVLTGPIDPSSLIIEKSPTEFLLYASGRANIAFANITLHLKHRNNPIALAAEYVLSFIFDLAAPPSDTVTIALYHFDGAEKSFFSSSAPSLGKLNNSKYDNFIWSIVNKQSMRQLREERYDISLTRTSDWPQKIPRWLSTMGESKEIGELVYTKELQDAVNDLPEGALEYLIISDQPILKPTKPSDTEPRKRIFMKLNLSATPPSETVPLLQAFIRLADHLPTIRFHANLQRKIQTTRDEQNKKMQKVKEEELTEEREQKRAEEKKRERDEKLRGMTAEEQKKFLEKEREKEMRRNLKKGSRKV